jgi:glycosyltransferase involved in cell wall biosynthesis
MKSVLLVIDSLGSGGAQNQITMLAVLLSRKGYSVTVFTYFYSDFYLSRLEENNIKTVHVPKKNRIGLGVIYKLWRYANTIDVDVVISFLNTPNFYVSLLGLISRKNRKIIVSYRSRTDVDDLSFGIRKMREIVNNCSTAIVSNSHHERMNWIKYYPQLNKKMKTIYNVVNQDRFTQSATAVKSESFVVVGSISSDKNGLAVIEALHLLAKRGVTVNILWIGAVQRTIKSRVMYYEKMKRLIDRYTLHNQWTWQDPQKNIEYYYQTHRGLILASTVEGLPNVVCEAQCCGLPCLVSNVLDHPLLVEDGVNGYLFDPEIPSSLADAIERFIGLSKEEYKIMSERSVESAEGKFSEKKFISSFIELIEE